MTLLRRVGAFVLVFVGSADGDFPPVKLYSTAGEEGEEDVGYLLTYLWNGRDCCSELLVFDAEGDLSQAQFPGFLCRPM